MDLLAANSRDDVSQGASLSTYCAVLLLMCVVVLVSATDSLAQTSNGPSVHNSALGAMRESAILNGDVRVIVRLSQSAVAEIDRDQSRQAAPRDGARAMAEALVSTSATINRTYTNHPFVAMTVNASDLDALVRSGRIEQIYPDLKVRLTLDGTNNVIRSPELWNQGLTGTGRSIAVIDTGVDAQHPFLANKVIAEACFSTSDSSTSMCPNQRGRQFGAGAADPNARNCFTSSGTNICSHGTHVAGIAAGIRDTQTPSGTISGVAPGASIIAVQVFHKTPFGPRANWSDLLAALDWIDTFDGNIAGTNIASVNMSLGAGQYRDYCDAQLLKDVIDSLLNDGVITAISAGNNGYTGAVGAPACISSAVTVAASTDSDELTGFSNISKVVDVVAPGDTVLSSVVGNQFSSYGGTSMAAPHVAGAAALLEQQGIDGGINVAAALTASNVTVCRSSNADDTERCGPRLELPTAINGQLIISEEYVTELTSTTAFVGFTSNTCGYGDYRYPGGSFVAPRDGVCYKKHGITLGVDTAELTPSTTYTVTLTLTDPDTLSAIEKDITFTTLGSDSQPEISRQFVSELKSTSAFVGFESNICGYGDYRYPGAAFVAPRDGVCYSKHGITLGRDTPPLRPNTAYRVTLTLTDPDTRATDVETISFRTPGSSQQPRIIRPYSKDITATTAFVGFTSNICGYGDYAHAGGTFVAPRNNICYTDHGITVGRDTPPLNPGTEYTVVLTLTDPETGAVATRSVSFKTLGTVVRPRILSPYVKDRTQTTAFVGYTSNICGFGDYRYNGGKFIAPRSYGCYKDHGITLGRDTPALTADTTYTVEFTLTDPVTNQVAKETLRFNTLGRGQGSDPGDGPQIPLTIGEKTNDQYGRNFGENKHPSRVVFKFVGQGQYLLLNYRGFDIDRLSEMTVRLNGKRLAAPRRSRNDVLSGLNSVVIENSDVVSGENTLEFIHSNAVDDKYGVSGVRLRDLYQAPIPLNLGERNDGRYGQAYEGVSSHLGGVTYSFENPGDSLILSLRGYDIDTKDEARVYLNNTTIGYLRPGSNNRRTGVSRFILDRTKFVGGTNSIYIIQKNPGARYGVTQAMIKPLTGPAASLSLDRRGTQRYGYLYAGSGGNHPQRLIVNFPAMTQAARIVMRGYDIDSATEVAVWLNNRRLGYLRTTRNNAEAWSSFTVPRTAVQSANKLELVQEKPGNRWGVRDMKVRPTQ